MSTARIVVDPAYRVGAIAPELFGSFIEHLGRCVYSGVYEPGHATADENGFRRDVLDLTRELGVTAVRYPGGNFVSGYDWEDAVGPRDQRPRRLELAWHSIESNQFGVDEFMDWTRASGTEPVMVVNLGTRGIDAARSLLEYCNHPSGTHWSDLRRRNGHPDPHQIRYWGLGNEMDGPWQIGHKTAEEYGRLAAETAKVMRAVDPEIQLVACGSSNSHMPTFPAWEATVLDHLYEHVDYLSLHSYYDPRSVDLPTFLASAEDMEGFIRTVVAVCDEVGARKRSKKRMQLAYDEWNVWNHGAHQDPPGWPEAPDLGQDTYTLADAVVVGSLLISLLRHADRVTMGCLAQLVNVIAPIRTERGGPAWRQTSFFPFADAARWARGDALQLLVDGPTYPTERYGEVPLLHAGASLDRERGATALFLVNRDTSEPLQVEADLRALGATRIVEHRVLAGGDPLAQNTEADPERVHPVEGQSARLEAGRLGVTLPPVSWTVLRLEGPPAP
jgi:alpha-N-arabinofuranosidase